MKKLIYCALALTTGLFAASCQQENLEPVAQGNTVTFEVSIPELATKGLGDNVSNINDLVYAVYSTTATTLENVQNGSAGYELLYQKNYARDVNPFNGGNTAIIPIELVNDKNYFVIFWAQNEDRWVGESFDLRSVAYPAEGMYANDNDYAAFSGISFITSDNLSAKKSVILKRPFAQINIGTQLATEFTITPTTSSVTVNKAGTSFNLIKQVAEGEGSVTFKTANVPTNPDRTEDGKLVVNNTAYTYVAMNYVFANGNVDVEYTINTEAHGTVSNKVSNVPVAANYRTNIVGRLLTSTADYTVVLGEFDTNNNSGTTEVITEGLVKNQNGDYEVSNENGLAYAINTLFAQGGDFYLTKALYDLTGYAVNPPAVPTGVVLNIYGETPIVTRSASDITAVTGVEIRGLSNLIDEVVGSASISGVKLSDDDAVLVKDATEGTLVVSNCEAETILPEGKGTVLEADNVENLAQLQAALVSGVKEINVVQTIVIAAGQVGEIDLNGKTVRAIDTTEKNFELIKNQGTLKIKNTVAETAVMTVEATHNNGWDRYSAVIANTVGGNLTVEGNIILEHLGGTDMAYGIDNLTNGKGTSAVTTIDGATVKSPYRAVRQFLNGTEATNKLTVKSGSKLYGNNKSIFFHDPSTGANSGELEVEEGAELYGDVYLFVTAGSTEWPVIVSIAASSLMDGSKVLSGNVPVTHSVVEDNGVWTVKTNEAIVGEVKYLTFAEAVDKAKSGETITLLSDVTPNSELTLPAGVTLNGNGKYIKGTICAGGDLTFEGYTKVKSFSAGYYNRTITIGPGACLEVEAEKDNTNRVTLGYGNTFNIIGKITDAKETDKESATPSLIINGGISITGGSDATMNVENAYVKIGSTTSKKEAANGVFTINFTNSIAEFVSQLTFSEPTNGKTPTFNVNVTNSVLTTGNKMIAAAPGCNIKVDNSVVTLGTYFRNSGKFDVVNGSVLTGATIQFGENGGNDGALTVDASTVNINASSTGHALDGKGTGSITLKNGAEVNIDYVKDMILAVEDGCTFTCNELLGNCSNRTVVADGVTKDENGAYYVSSAAGLEKMNQMFSNKSAGRDVVLNLTEDIDFIGKTWTPVDSHADTAFEIAEINGNGHTISNLTINGQAMFTRFAGTGDVVVVKDITFDNATVNSKGSINTSIVVGHTYQNVLFDNVDVKNSSITGGYKVAPLIGTVYNESTSTITANLKNCDVEDVTVKATSYDFCTTGMVAFVYADDNDTIAFEKCTVTKVKLYAPAVYTAHAAIYTTGSETLFNEAEGVTVTNVTFENI